MADCEECPICLDKLCKKPTHQLKCGHVFCEDCVLAYANRTKGQVVCALCRAREPVSPPGHCNPRKEVVERRLAIMRMHVSSEEDDEVVRVYQASACIGLTCMLMGIMVIVPLMVILL